MFQLKQMGLHRTVVAVLLVILLACLWFALAWPNWGRQSKAEPQQAWAPAPGAPQTPVASDDATREVFERVEAQRAALARAQLLEFAQLADDASASIDGLTAQVKRWETEVTPLLRNAEGRTLTSERSHVEMFQDIYFKRERPSPQLPDQLRQRLNTLAAPIRSALQDTRGAYTPDETIRNRLQALRHEADAATANFRDDADQILSLLAAAKRQEARPGLPLAEALENLKTEYALERAKAIAAAAEAERKKADDELATLEAERVRREAELELAQKRQQQKIREEEAERKRQIAAADALLKQQNDERAFLRKLAADPAVQAEFKPFLAKGYYRFNAYGVSEPQWRNAFPQPASFADLQNAGVFVNVYTFCKTACGLGITRNIGDTDGYRGAGIGNDRPKWQPYPHTEQQWQKVQTAYELFQKLAPFWVESGVLRP